MPDVKFRPLFDRVLLKRTNDVDDVGGIIIPESAKEKSRKGIVVAIGPGVKNEKGILIPTELKVGDTVIFGIGVGLDMDIDGEEYLIIPEIDAMAKIMEDD